MSFNGNELHIAQREKIHSRQAGRQADISIGIDGPLYIILCIYWY